MHGNAFYLFALQDTGKPLPPLPEKPSFASGDSIPFFEPLLTGINDTALPASQAQTLSDPAAESKKTDDKVYVKSLFTGHLLQAKKTDYKAQKNEHPYWVPLLMLIVFSVYTWVKIWHPQRLDHLFRSLYDNNTMNQLKREESFSIRNIIIYLMCCFICIFSLFLYKAYVIYQFTFLGTNGLLVFIKLCSITALIYGVKIILLRLSGYLFECQENTHDYIYSILIFNIILGIALSPFLLLAFYLQWISPSLFINAGFVLIAILLIYKTIRGLLAGSANPRIPKFYLFLYLCTLEIIPFLVVFKLITGRMQ